MTLIEGALLASLTSRARGLARGQRRAVLGIVGAPGSGKTTFADELARRLCVDGCGPVVARMPMDGFHLANTELTRMGRRDRKGAPDTFDVDGYVALLRRVREDRDHVVYAPAFDRRIEEPIAGSIAITPSTWLVITEGNYLLADGEWTSTRQFLDEVWYVEVDEQERMRRLVARHVEFGKPAIDALEWALHIDQPNADLVASSRHRAHVVVRPDRGQILQLTN